MGNTARQKRVSPRAIFVRRATIVAAMIGGILAGAMGPASAEYTDRGMGFLNINIKPVGVDSYWFGILDQSATNWNSTAARTSIRRNESAAIYTAGQYGANIGWYGIYEPYNENYVAPGTKCVNRRFSIRINADAIVRDAGSSSNHYAWNVSTTTHEIGHALSLNHTSDVTSIMNNTRNRTQITTPDAYKDVPEVIRYQQDFGCK